MWMKQSGEPVLRNSKLIKGLINALKASALVDEQVWRPKRH